MLFRLIAEGWGRGCFIKENYDFFPPSPSVLDSQDAFCAINFHPFSAFFFFFDVCNVSVDRGKGRVWVASLPFNFIL